MKDYLTALFMAWGNFLSIPCPVKKWDESLREKMLTTLPLIGGIVGVLWFALTLILEAFGLPLVVTAFLMTLYIYGVTGFLHLDGFMDVRDALMSARDMDERKRILKDPHVGAFAVISVIILILGMFSGCMGLVATVRSLGETLSARGETYSLWPFYLPLIVIPTASRTCSGQSVLRNKPMEGSQYAKTMRATSSKGKSKAGTFVMSVMAIIIICASFAIGLLVLGVQYIQGLKSGDVVKTFGDVELKYMSAVLLSFAFTFGAVNREVKRGIRSLGGMNGDIAGYSICVGEVVGILATTIALGILNTFV